MVGAGRAPDHSVAIPLTVKFGVITKRRAQEYQYLQQYKGTSNRIGKPQSLTFFGVVETPQAYVVAVDQETEVATALRAGARGQ